MNYELHSTKAAFEDRLYIYTVVFDNNTIRSKEYKVIDELTFGNFDFISQYVHLRTTVSNVSKILIYPSDIFN